MADLTLTKRQLNIVITHATREIRKAEDLRTVLPLNPVEISASLAKLDSYQTRISEYSDTVLSAAEDSEDLDADIERFEAIKDNLIESVAKLKAALLRAERDENPGGEGGSPNSNEDGTGRGGRFDVSVKLPKLQLAKFDGDPMKFQEFWDTFDTTVHQNPKLASVEKFKYLRSYLDGSALVLSEGYSLTNANYDTVVEVLKERYGDPELAIFCHLDALLAVPLAGTKAQELRRTYDECDCHIRSLVSLGMPESTFGRVYVPIILSKLPTQVRISLHQKKGTGVCWALPELRDMIRTEIYAREMGVRSFGSIAESNEYKSAQQTTYQRKFSGPPTAAALSASANQRSAIMCVFCGGSHYSDRCLKHPDVDRRRRAIGLGCFICLRRGHSAANCRSKKPCFYCKRDTHHRSLCPKQFGKDKRTASIAATEAKCSTTVSGASPINATLVSNGKRGILQTALAEVSGELGSARARLLLDVGSDNTFATNGLLKRIGARKTGTDVVGLAGFQTTKRCLTSSPIHEVILTLNNGRTLRLDTYGINTITCPIHKPTIDVASHPILQSLPLAEPLSEVEAEDAVEIDILIGSDHYYDIVNHERITIDEDMLLLGSKLGYILAGRVNMKSPEQTALITSLAKTPLLDAQFELERFWRLEDIGITDKAESSDDQYALEAFNRTLTFDSDEKRYQVKWPWKEGVQGPPDNFALAFGRLKSLSNRLRDNRSIWEKYQSTIEEQLSSGMIEPCPLQPDGDIVHYLPHHGVIKPDKSTTKLRIVFDASCRKNRQTPTLNDCMYRGPVMLHDMCGLILRFRLSRIAIVSDLEKAFLQIGLQAPDRDAVRFLWLRFPEKPCSQDNIVSYRFKRVCFGVVASPFLLAAVVAHLLSMDNSPTARSIAETIYVDNVIGGVGTTHDALAYYTEARRIFAEASMNLREFFSNDQSFMKSIPTELRGKGTETKVLGVTWNTSRDCLSISTGNPMPSQTAPTKRIVLRQIARVFDPCGFFAPIIVTGKLIMQEIWQQKYAWDDPLAEEIGKRWHLFQSDCKLISSYHIPRYVDMDTSLKAGKVSLHCFCDASSKAYSAVVYLRLREHKIVVHLLFAKARVAPLDRHTIPRLELLAIHIGAKVTKFIQTELRLNAVDTVIWSDSQCALSWILRKAPSSQFVKNRVKTIRELQGAQFRFVPSQDNPADLATRGLRFADLSNSALWWQGPDWLREPEDCWPTSSIDIRETNDESMKPVTVSAIEVSSEEYIFDPTRTSTLSKIVRIASYALRFVDRLKNRQSEANGFTIPELNRAKARLVREAQLRHHANVLTSEKPLDRNLVEQLGLFQDSHNLLRCSGRIQCSDLPSSAKNPLLLPKNDPLTELVIKDCHSRLHHAGVKHTLAELRYEYWVVRGRSEIKRVLSRCSICKWLKGGALTTPPPPPLPEFRVRKERAFGCVGVDYLGPLTIYSSRTDVSKCWICIFACTTSRAIHLEVITTMTAEEFLLAFRRFVASYGCPRMVISDNAKTFVSADKVLQKAWLEVLRDPVVLDFSSANAVEWKFIVELAPWMGGFYERLIGLVKHSCGQRYTVEERH